MAANTNTDNCPICLSAYHHPKLLECQHSFCLICLEDYIIKTSSNGHFPCPLCRHDITVPEGGVPEFPAMSEINRSSTECHACKKDVSKFRCQDCQQNLCQSCTTTHDMLTVSKHHLVRKIDEEHADVDNSKGDNSQAQDRKPAPNVIDACPDHRDKAVDVYCKQCLVAMCCMCFITDHNGHEFSNLQDDEIKKSIRDELKTLNAEMETHILKLEQFSVNLTIKHTELTNSLEAACAKVDQQVARICTEVKTLGETIKKDMKENYDGMNAQSGGETNIKQLMEEIETLTQGIKAVVKETVGVLEDNYIVPVLERMPKIRKEIKGYGTRKMEVPDIPNISFKESIIDLGILRQQLGRTVNTNKTIFEHKFDLNRVCNGKTESSPDFMYAGVQWYIRAMRDDDDKLYISLTRSPDYSGSCAFKLVSQINDSQSIIKQPTRSYTSHYAYSIDWETLCNPVNGFLVNNMFNIQLKEF